MNPLLTQSSIALGYTIREDFGLHGDFNLGNASFMTLNQVTTEGCLANPHHRLADFFYRVFLSAIDVGANSHFSTRFTIMLNELCLIPTTDNFLPRSVGCIYCLIHILHGLYRI
jgi:hypothetical protein